MNQASVMERLAGEIALAPVRELPDSQYACADCQDRGVIYISLEPRVTRQCPCKVKAGEERRMRLAGIPAKYAGATLRGFETTDADLTVAMAARRCRGMVEEYLLNPQGQGLLLTGTCGVGKTHLAVATLRAVMRKYGVAGRFWDMGDLLLQMKRTYGRSGSTYGGAEAGERETESSMVEAFSTVDALVVDELGGERLTDWSSDAVRLLLNGRYNGQGDRARLTVFTTNFPNLGPGQGVGGSETLGDRIGARMFSRLQEMCRVVEMSGRDYRMRRKG